MIFKDNCTNGKHRITYRNIKISNHTEQINNDKKKPQRDEIGTDARQNG
jgi:hypothetical protein